MKATHAQQAERTFRTYRDLRGGVITSSAWRELKAFIFESEERPSFAVIDDAVSPAGAHHTDGRAERCAQFFAELSSNKPRPRPNTVEP